MFIIYELFSVYVDSTKMELVSNLIDQRPNLKTVILNPKILTYSMDLIEPWFWKLNSLNLRFLHADEVEDISAAFQELDDSGNGKISINELTGMCGPRIARYWGYKYGNDYEVKQ